MGDDYSMPMGHAKPENKHYTFVLSPSKDVVRQAHHERTVNF